MSGEHKPPMILSAVSDIFFFASMPIVIASGPNSFSVLTESAALGRGAGLRATKGVCTGTLVRAVAVLSGMAAFFQASALAFIARGISRSSATADGLRRDVGAFVSGLGYASVTRAVVLYAPAR